MNGLLVIAVDGLHWPLLLEQSASRLPHAARWLAGGSHARLAMPASASASATARWTTLACGTDPRVHGAVHDLACRADGLRVEPLQAADLHTWPLWRHAWQGGLRACVAGWPATAGSAVPAAAGPGSVVVADGFQQPDVGVQRAWPLAPAAVAPPSARGLVHAARMHPCEVLAQSVAALLEPALTRPDEASPALQEASALLLARWASVHNLGVHWCAQGSEGLVMLRLDGLPAWRQAAAAAGLEGAAAESCWLRWLDLILGRYAELLAERAHLMLLSDQGHTAVADGASDPDCRGGVLLAGPGAALLPSMLDGNELLLATRWLGLAQCLLGLPDRPLQLGQTDRMVARDPGLIDAATATPLCDEAALAWLLAQGLPPVDLSALSRRALSVRQATIERLGPSAPDLRPGALSAAPSPQAPRS